MNDDQLRTWEDDGGRTIEVQTEEPEVVAAKAAIKAMSDQLAKMNLLLQETIQLSSTLGNQGVVVD